MDKLLVLGASCVNTHATDTPSAFAIYVYDDLRERIKKLAETVRDLGVESIDDVVYGAWRHGDCPIDLALSHATAKELMCDIETTSEKMESDRLQVFADRFRFTAVQRDLGDDMRVNTFDVRLCELDNDEPLILADPT